MARNTFHIGETNIVDSGSPIIRDLIKAASGSVI